MGTKTVVIFPWTIVPYLAFRTTKQTTTTASLEEQVLLVELRDLSKTQHKLSHGLPPYTARSHLAQCDV